MKKVVYFTNVALLIVSTITKSHLLMIAFTAVVIVLTLMIFIDEGEIPW